MPWPDWARDVVASRVLGLVWLTSSRVWMILRDRLRRMVAVNQPRSEENRFHEVTFTFDSRVRELGITGMYFVMEGLRNQTNHDEFDELLVQELEALDDSVLHGYDVKTDPILKGFRDLHAQLGLSNRNNVSSAENLLRMIRMNGSIPRVNLLVDICSLVSLRTRLAVGA